MSTRVLLVATRNPDKLREIRQILGFDEAKDCIRIIDLSVANIAETVEEDGLEQFSTFEENALAKARHFAIRSGFVTLADDSGLCVDALGGAPGVHSKRFSGRTELRGAALDEANNETLLRKLEAVPLNERSARYVCAVALVDRGGHSVVFRGSCEGRILRSGRGAAGFGYDPLFFLPSEDATVGELSADYKNRLSHRAEALRQARPAIREALDRSSSFH
jgi:XTP/dITP diphosphohydrolase